MIFRAADIIDPEIDRALFGHVVLESRVDDEELVERLEDLRYHIDAVAVRFSCCGKASVLVQFWHACGDGLHVGYSSRRFC